MNKNKLIPIMIVVAGLLIGYMYGQNTDKGSSLHECHILHLDKAHTDRAVQLLRFACYDWHGDKATDKKKPAKKPTEPKATGGLIAPDLFFEEGK